MHNQATVGRSRGTARRYQPPIAHNACRDGTPVPSALTYGNFVSAQWRTSPRQPGGGRHRGAVPTWPLLNPSPDLSPARGEGLSRHQHRHPSPEGAADTQAYLLLTQIIGARFRVRKSCASRTQCQAYLNIAEAQQRLSKSIKIYLKISHWQDTIFLWQITRHVASLPATYCPQCM